jgi:hypothetical protein
VSTVDAAVARGSRAGHGRSSVPDPTPEWGGAVIGLLLGQSVAGGATCRRPRYQGTACRSPLLETASRKS